MARAIEIPQRLIAPMHNWLAQIEGIGPDCMVMYHRKAQGQTMADACRDLDSTLPPNRLITAMTIVP